LIAAWSLRAVVSARCAVRLGGVALVGQDPVGTGAWPARSGLRDADLVQRGAHHGGVAHVPTGQDPARRAALAVGDQLNQHSDRVPKTHGSAFRSWPTTVSTGWAQVPGPVARAPRASPRTVGQPLVRSIDASWRRQCPGVSHPRVERGCGVRRQPGVGGRASALPQNGAGTPSSSGSSGIPTSKNPPSSRPDLGTIPSSAPAVGRATRRGASHRAGSAGTGSRV